MDDDSTWWDKFYNTVVVAPAVIVLAAANVLIAWRYSPRAILPLNVFILVYNIPSYNELFITTVLLITLWQFVKWVPKAHNLAKPYFNLYCLTRKTLPSLEALEQSITLIERNVEFEYEPLPKGCFRLLRLQECSCPLICCEVVVASLDPVQPTKFTALSYTWENQAQYRPLLISGQTIVVTPNVEAFLRAAQRAHQLWKSTRSEIPKPEFLDANDLFWIDAVCINQADDEERGSQVAMMRRIYESAHSIPIWLGEPRNLTRQALKFIEHVAAGNEATPVSADETKEIVTSLVELLERPNWRRSWVLQDVRLQRWGNLMILFNLHIVLKVMKPTT
jgi:Heterokaryon incompatibility protein (HET)